MLANRLYKWKTPENCLFLTEKDSPNQIFEAPKNTLRENHYQVPEVSLYSLHMIAYKLCGCCRGKYWVKDYQETLAKVKQDASSQLDIVHNLRRLRAHGFAMSMLLEKKTLNICSE